jgi:hypothetical protein
MSSNTTRITDLPENITMQISPDTNPMRSNHLQEQNLSYTPMNIHPNPYGNSIQNEVMPLPQSQPKQPQQFQQSEYQPLSPEQQQLLQDMPPVRLPSRDIPMDQTAYQQDIEITPNYIPKPKLTNDYIKKYEEVNEEKVREHEKKRNRMDELEDIFTDIQIPILISILFFIFQMPVVNTMLYKNFTFLTMYNTDGNINFYGIFFKSMLFGIMFYFFRKITDFITNF